jgi:hypothetical protein
MQLEDDVGFPGQFEQTVRAAVLALRGDAHGVTIHAKVEELSRPKRPRT